MVFVTDVIRLRNRDGLVLGHGRIREVRLPRSVHLRIPRGRARRLERSVRNGPLMRAPSSVGGAGVWPHPAKGGRTTTRDPSVRDRSYPVGFSMLTILSSS